MRMQTEAGVEINVRNVHVVRASGRTYVYHRPSGTRIVDVREVPGAIVALPGALAEIDRLNRPRVTPLPGTLGGVFDAFRAGPRWAAFAIRTRRDYEGVFSWLERSGRKSFSAMPIQLLSAHLVANIRDYALQTKGWRFANYLLSLLRILSDWACEKGIIDKNAVSGVRTVRRPVGLRHCNRPWTSDEIATVLAEVRASAPQLELPILIARYTGMRQGDVINLLLTAWDGFELSWIARKNGAACSVTPPSELALALEHRRQLAPSQSRKLCVNARGQSWAKNGAGFRASFFRVVRELTTKGRVRPGLTFHGLRHTIGAQLAEAGASEETIKAVLGNTSSASVAHYLRGADKGKAVRRGMELIAQAADLESSTSAPGIVGR